MSGVLDVMRAVAAVQTAIPTVRKAHVTTPPPAVVVSTFPTFLNVWEPADSESGVDMRVTKGTVRMQCLLAKAEPGDETIQESVLALWDATHDAFCHATTLGGKATVGIRVGGSDVPAFLDRGGQLYIGFEMRLSVQITEAFAWS